MCNIPINTCVNIDSIKFMEDYVGEPFADLVFADPPFNINWKYDIYIDKKSDDEFLNWNRKWINLAITKCLKENGQIYICMGDEYVADIITICKREFGLYQRDWLIWHYGFGQSGKLDKRTKFTKSKTHIIRFSKGKRPYFDPISIAVPSGRLTKYADKRADPRGKCPDDVFIYKRIAGTHSERVKGMSTQMPPELVKPWIIATTKRGDLVYDPFPGSGVVPKICLANGRNFVATELSPEYSKRINTIISLYAS